MTPELHYSPPFPTTKSYQAAVSAYDSILDEQLDLVGPNLLLRRANCYFALGRWLQAAADAGRAAKLAAEGDMDQGGSGARERAQALELRGRCYIQLGDFEMAANHFREVTFAYMGVGILLSFFFPR